MNLCARASSASGIVAIALLSGSTILNSQSTSLNQHYHQTNLVADTAGMAMMTDPNLVNPWGMSRSSTSPWWVSDNGPGLATLYNGAGTPVALKVTIPSAAGSSQSGTPTGQVFNGTSDFQLAAGKPALFIFVTEDGTVSGWNPGVQATTAVVKVNTRSASVYKGVAIGTMDEGHGPVPYLYVADFRKGHVDVFDTRFHRVDTAAGAFEDSRLPDGFAPFNVQNVGGDLYVAFARQDSARHDEVDGAGLGYVDVFSPQGRLLRRLAWGDWFNAPWGIAQAPGDFGMFSHDVLVGQFGSGEILAFDPVTGSFKGHLNDAKGHPIAIKGLWGIGFGNGGNAGPANSLYFAAGTDDEQHGLFGTITAIENLLGGDI